MPRRFDEERRNKYARSAQAWLALVAQATHRRTTTYDALGELLLSHPMKLRSDLDPIDDYCNEHGLPPLVVVCVDPMTGEPSRGNVGVFRLITYANYMIEDYLEGITVTGPRDERMAGSDAAIPRFEQQLSIVESKRERFRSSLLDIRQLEQLTSSIRS